MYSTDIWIALGVDLEGKEILSLTGIQLLDCPVHSDFLY
jgi:hypothetical protein